MTGILGHLQENDDDAVSSEKSSTANRYKKTGKPTNGVLVVAHTALFIEGDTDTGY